jgi:hypothetical protein
MRVPDGVWITVTVALAIGFDCSLTIAPRMADVVSWACTAAGRTKAGTASAASATPRRR